jgi:hypothetical protein
MFFLVHDTWYLTPAFQREGVGILARRQPPTGAIHNKEKEKTECGKL